MPWFNPHSSRWPAFRSGKALFLIVAAAFLCDAWLQLTDGFSRIQADFFYSNIKGAQKLHYRSWYYNSSSVYLLS